MRAAAFQADAKMDDGRVRVDVTRTREGEPGTLVVFRDVVRGDEAVSSFAFFASPAELFVLADILRKASGPSIHGPDELPPPLHGRAKAWLYEHFSGRWSGNTLESLVDLVEGARVQGFDMGLEEAVGILRARLDTWAHAARRGAP